MSTILHHTRRPWATAVAAAVAAITATADPAAAQQPDPTAAIAEMQKQIRALQEEVQRLQSLAAPATAPVPPSTPTAPAPEPATDQGELLGDAFFKSQGLSIGFYGESKYRFPESGANSFDAHRYVLTPSFAIADWLVFNSELELEHGGVDESTGRGSRFSGEIELEQFYVDILINDHFNIRSLGVDLVPVGRINITHEPTTFYSTERPELYREIIPTTWMEPSIGVFGRITEGLDYRLMVSTGLEDYSSSSPGSPGVTAAAGMRNARPRLRAADENKLAYTARLHFNGIRGLDASTSLHHATAEGFDQRDVDMTLWNVEALYRVPRTGLELRADFAHWFISDPENLLANNNASLADNVGDAMYGWYAEVAYHLWPDAWRHGRGTRMNFVPFIRYSQIVTQSGLDGGVADVDDGTTNRDFLTLGASWFLTEHFVVKGDYRWNLDGTAAAALSAASQDYFQIGVGMAF